MMIPIAPQQADADLRDSMPLPRPQLGTGTRLTANSIGSSISVDGNGGNYRHPFKPSLTGAALVFSRGLVDGIYEPTINGVPISGDAKHGQPRLRLDANVANADGESWACVEVRLDAKGQLTSETVIEMVHTNKPVSIEPLIGRCPIAQVIWRDGRPRTVFSIIKFNLRYYRVLPPPGGGVAQHYFL